MPKVKAYTPTYLASGSGNALFAAPNDSGSPYATKKKGNRKPLPGPCRTIARRGTELFVASGREIRWGDLVYLKDVQENHDITRARSRRSISIKLEDQDEIFPRNDVLEGTAKGFRVIKAPVADDIHQLILSPNSNYLAVITTHTCHIMVIPDSSHLTSEDTGPIKPKIWTLGPTTHITSRASIASVLWHPLGVDGSCIVTVTEDAIVRLWELSLSDRWSFDQPTLDIDLKKLADGTGLDQNFSASISATNTGFSPDSFEMEVASACFASRNSGGWSPFTLWIAMREGDIYALCPFLPQKWSAPPTLVPSLSVSIVERLASIEDDPEASEYEKLLAQQQLAWMAEIDAQEPNVLEGAPGVPDIEIFTRPLKPGACPRLQGPFEVCADLEDQDDIDSEYTDILVIGPKIDSENLIYSEDINLAETTENEGLSLSIICLLSTGGQVKICLDAEGVEAQWLPPRSKNRLSKFIFHLPQPTLLLYQAMNSMSTTDSNPNSWPVFSTDVMSKYTFYVTHNVGITSFSLSNWVFLMESELQGSTLNGSEFRIGQLVNKTTSDRDRLYMQTSSHASSQMAACIAINDPDIGYGIISSSSYKPVMLLFDLPEEEFAIVRQESPNLDVEDRAVESSPKPLFSYEPRPAYTPSISFDQPSMLPVLLDRLKSSNHRIAVSQEVRLSPMTLQVLTDVHKILSDETHELGLAASDLFLKCDRMHAEMRDQLVKAAEIKARIDKIVGGDEGSDQVRVEDRIAQASSRQQRLTERLQALRKDANSVSKREISQKERAFIDEVQSLNTRICGPDAMAEEGSDPSGALSRSIVSLRKNNSRVTEPWQRFNTVKQLAETLKGEAQEFILEADQRDTRAFAAVSGNANLSASVNSLPGRGASPAPSSTGTGSVIAGDSISRSGTPDLRIPPDLRKTRLQQVKTMLTRETALIEAVTARLERLQTDL